MLEDSVQEVMSLLNAIEHRRNYHKIDYYNPYEFQKKFHNAKGRMTDEPANQRALMCANQIGKLHPVSTQVAVPDGWREIGDLAVGDRILGGNGKSCQVTGVFPQGVKPFYRVTFDDDASVLVGKEHLWKVVFPQNRFQRIWKSSRKTNGQMIDNKDYMKWDVISTGEMLDRWGAHPKPVSRPIIPVCAAEFDGCLLPMPPYALGALLGDGGFSQSSVILTSADPEIPTRVAKELQIECVHDGRYRYRLKGAMQYLRLLGLNGKRSWEKSIPEIYLNASLKDRIALLHGLMDTDGTAGKKSGCIEFSTTSQQLAKDVQYLFRSLGMKCRIMERTTTYTYKGNKKKGRLSYRVRPRWNGVRVFGLDRKHERCFVSKSTCAERLVVSIKEEGEGEAVCIAVDSPDRTYLTEDFIVTHNTTCGAMEVAYHATGLYPDWWEGIRFTNPVRILCGSNTNEQTRDNLQAELCGDPTDDKLLGTGAIPKECLGERIRKPGVPNAFDSIAVRHVDGGTSRVMFRAYEQGAKKHMGSRIDFGWMDEEPPQDIYSQYLRGTFATGGKLIITFTPEEGVTDVVHQFMTDLQKGQAIITATWDDAPHMTKERRDEFLSQIPAHEREMRTKGIPKMGSGLVFPVKDEDIMIAPIDIPSHWPRIIGMDFGWDHPSAAAWLAWDRDTDTTYMYHEYRQSNAIIPIVASAIKNGSEPWMPVAWPHDGMKRDSQSGRPLADLYRKEGLNMLTKPFSNPPPPGKRDGDGGQGIEIGIMAMLTAMEEGRFKVFSNCKQWFEEKGTYHRKDGQIVAKRDDLLSASRYAYQSRRYASTKPTGQRVVPIRKGMRTW